MISYAEFMGNNKFTVDDLYQLQEETEKENKKSYHVEDGVRYINIVNCDRIFWNASSICSVLSDDLKQIDKRISTLSYSRLHKLLCKIINSNEMNNCDKKIKDWICRNYKTYYDSKANRELNRMIRNNYKFYYSNRHKQLWM